MDNQIHVSVIVPVYNTEKYLRKCLHSLVNQTLQNIEIVVVNDGSTDHSQKIIDEYKHKYPDKFQIAYKQNGGQASARNLALSMCNGTYIGFLDSDDYVKSEMYEKMFCKAIAENADYVACGYTDLTYQNNEEIILKEYVASKLAFCNRELFFGALVSPFLHLYKRDVILRSHVRFPEGIIYEDTAFYLNLIPHIRKIAVIEEALAVRVRRPNSTTAVFLREKVAHIFPVLTNSLEYYKKYGFDQVYEKELEYFCIRILFCSSLKRISRVKYYRDRIELMKQTFTYSKAHFPEYKKNPYLKKGKLSFYIKSLNALTFCVYMELLHLESKLKGEGRKR